MKVVVTGGAGFIGSHLIDWLAENTDDEILVLDNLRRGKLDHISQHEANPNVTFVKADICDYQALCTAFEGATYVYHLAAQSNVMGAVKDVDTSFETNVVGTFNVLKAAKATGVQRVMFTSSREVYGEAQYVPVDEGHPIGSKNTYGASKVAGEMYCQVFYQNFGLETAVLRLANVYGARDSGRVIPLWLGRAKTGQDLIVYGGKQVIDFVWVAQVVQALVKATTADIIGMPINVGSGKGMPILELAERILSLTTSPSQLDLHPARGVEVVRFEAQVDKMQTHLGLTPPDDPLIYLNELIG